GAHGVTRPTSTIDLPNETVASLRLVLAGTAVCPGALEPGLPRPQHGQGHVSGTRCPCQHSTWRPLVPSGNAKDPRVRSKSNSTLAQRLARKRASEHAF